ncbi:MAG: hypothetical protein ACLQPH_08130 [Acidimicrobiales bacterium]
MPVVGEERGRMAGSGTWSTTVPPLHVRVGRLARRRLRRATTNPFESGADRVLLVHCGYHKAATVWFRQVLLEVMRPYGLRQQEGKSEPIRPRTDLAFYANAGSFHRDQVGSRAFRGSHLIRDPRDLVVSGYEYHLVTSEPWIRKPTPRYGGLSYQAHLWSLDERDGLMAEIEWFARGTGAAMGAWDYQQPEFLELRYEDALADELATFERLFRWYGFNDAARGVGLGAVERLSLRRGGAIPNHARSGLPGEWRTRLGSDHIERLRELTGDLVVRLGYEDASSW